MIISRKMAEEACETLGWGRETLNGEMTAEGVNAQFRAAARLAHPDAGGDAATFVAVDRAKHVLLAWLAKQAEAPSVPHGGSIAVCPRCLGAGHITIAKGFKSMPMQCPTCFGNGVLIEREKTADGR